MTYLVSEDGWDATDLNYTFLYLKVIPFGDFESLKNNVVNWTGLVTCREVENQGRERRLECKKTRFFLVVSQEVEGRRRRN